MTLTELFTRLAGFDPAPLFALSLFPYLAFLWFAWRSKRLPRLSLIGFGLTLVFVAVTIAAALLAEGRYGRQLADVDPLHGGAEAFLTLSNLLVLLGFHRAEEAAVASEPRQPAPPDGPA